MACVSALAQAPTAASVPYTPSWMARHHLQWLSDHAGLALTTSHWPLPALAVAQALDKLPNSGKASEASIQTARDFVRKELAAQQTQGQIRLHLRTESEALNGFDDAYTPGSSAQLTTAEVRQTFSDVSVAGRLGARIEANALSLQQAQSGLGADGQYQVRLDGSAAVLGWQGWNVQAFAHPHWWGPGWQSSLVNGHNNPAWQGVGIQRASSAPSENAWLQWMGPWSLDLFVAKAQDPIVMANQPSGFLFSGARLTLKPQPWLEVGLSRGMQTGGAGRPSGPLNFVKAFFGQELNKDPDSPFEDSSGQIAGYDLRVSCPPSLGGCAGFVRGVHPVDG